MPNGTCLRSCFLNFLFLPALRGCGLLFCVFAIRSYAVAFFLPATVPLRGPLRVRALVWVRCPRTGRSGDGGSRGRTEFDEALDVHRDVLAEIAFDVALVLNHLADAVDLVLAQVLDLLEGVDIGLLQDLERREGCRCRRCK